jgi:hypothetical protein
MSNRGRRTSGGTVVAEGDDEKHSRELLPSFADSPSNPLSLALFLLAIMSPTTYVILA